MIRKNRLNKILIITSLLISIAFNNFAAAACWACFFDAPSASTYEVSFNLTATLKFGLCLGPVLETNL